MSTGSSDTHDGAGQGGGAPRGDRRRHVTGHDVAAHAGVSQSTVSLVLSGNPKARIADSTRKRVVEAARELGYRPNLLARGLAQRRSFALGVVVREFENPFFTEVVSGAQRVAAEAGYGVLLADTGQIPAVEHVMRLRERQVDGVILAGVPVETLPEEALADANVVVVDEPSGRYPAVASDAAGAGRKAAEHLLSLGHRVLAFMGPADPSHAFRMRERGFVEALRQAGCALTSARLQRAPPSVRGGDRAMAALLSRGPHPTGVFCANDLMALGALKACATHGIVVPKDVSVVGCDDIQMARYVTPELTTVMVPARGLGARAARLLLLTLEDRTLEDRETGALSGRPLEVEFIDRQTTAPPPGGAE